MRAHDAFYAKRLAVGPGIGCASVASRFTYRALAGSLDVDFDHLTTAIHPICWVDTVWAVKCAVLGIFSQLRKFELNGAAAFATALLGLFAFWLTHDRDLLKRKNGSNSPARTRRRTIGSRLRWSRLQYRLFRVAQFLCSALKKLLWQANAPFCGE